jgi:hypothetical protein
MSKRLQHPRGPANIKKNFLKPVLSATGEAVLKLHKGFTGFTGWSYHPTRGFKKVNGFKPDFFQNLTAVSVAKSVDEELAELLSDDYNVEATTWTHLPSTQTLKQ